MPDTAVFLLKIIWTLVRGFVFCMQIILSFLIVDASLPAKPGSMFWGGILGILLVLFFIVAHYSSSRGMKKMLVALLLADAILVAFFLVVVFGWPFLTVSVLLLLLIQLFLVISTRKELRADHAPFSRGRE